MDVYITRNKSGRHIPFAAISSAADEESFFLPPPALRAFLLARSTVDGGTCPRALARDKGVVTDELEEALVLALWVLGSPEALAVG